MPGTKRIPPDGERCDAITLRGTRCRNYGAVLAGGDRWCGHHEPGYGTMPKALAPLAEIHKRNRVHPTPDHVHGTLNGYANYGCRCDACKAASARYVRERRAKVSGEVAAGEREVPHGTTNAYQNYGCRCRACTNAAVATSWGYKATGDSPAVGAISSEGCESE